MKKALIYGALAAGLCLAAVTGASAGSQDAQGAFSSVEGFNTPDQKQVDLNAAITDYQARKPNGFSTIVNIGTQNNATTYNGSVVSSSSANIGSSNSTSITASGGSSASVSTTQTTSDLTQGSTAGVTTGEVITTNH